MLTDCYLAIFPSNIYFAWTKASADESVADKVADAMRRCQWSMSRFRQDRTWWIAVPLHQLCVCSEHCWGRCRVNIWSSFTRIPVMSCVADRMLLYLCTRIALWRRTSTFTSEWQSVSTNLLIILWVFSTIMPLCYQSASEPRTVDSWPVI
jgi:hypothetical protein